MVRGRAIGVALLGCRHREPLPTRHLSFLHAVLPAVAAAIHHAQLAVAAEAKTRRAARPADVVSGCQLGPEPRRSPTGTPVQTERGHPSPFLDIRCLGNFTIVRDGRVIPPERFVRRRALTLLKILLLRYGQPVHREELLDLLCPEMEFEAANNCLNVAVHYLRRGLDPQADAARLSRFIQRNREYYWFDTGSPHRLDTREFVQTADLGIQLEAAGQPRAALEAYQHAITLYGGDLLAEERYSDWCALEREYLRERYLNVLRRAARLHAVLGESEAAEASYRRALQVDATLEDVHRALMELLWHAGRRDEALRQYRECRAILARELEVEPSPETEVLRQQIATNDSLVDAIPRR